MCKYNLMRLFLEVLELIPKEEQPLTLRWDSIMDNNLILPVQLLTQASFFPSGTIPLL